MIEDVLLKRIKKSKSKALPLADLLAEQLSEAKIPFRRECPFSWNEPTWIYHKVKNKPWSWDQRDTQRKWTADFVIMRPPWGPLLIEVDGSTQNGGRHNRGTALENQYIRDAMAQAWGYDLIRVTRSMILKNVAMSIIKRMVTQ